MPLTLAKVLGRNVQPLSPPLPANGCSQLPRPGLNIRLKVWVNRSFRELIFSKLVNQGHLLFGFQRIDFPYLDPDYFPEVLTWVRKGGSREWGLRRAPASAHRDPAGFPGRLPEPGDRATGLSPPGVEGLPGGWQGPARGPRLSPPGLAGAAEGAPSPPLSSPPAAWPTFSLLPSLAHLLLSRHDSQSLPAVGPESLLGA